MRARLPKLAAGLSFSYRLAITSRAQASVSRDAVLAALRANRGETGGAV